MSQYPVAKDQENATSSLVSAPPVGKTKPVRQPDDSRVEYHDDRQENLHDTTTEGTNFNLEDLSRSLELGKIRG
jgi:hypothetical protein